MKVYQRYETDKEKETKGVRLPLGDGGFVTVARMNNTAYQEYLRVHASHLRPAIRANDDQPVPELLPIIRAAVASTVLLGWEGFEDRDGKPIKYTPGEAAKLFEELPELYDRVIKMATDVDNFRVTEVAKSKGN